MPPEVLQAIGAVLGIVLSGAFLTACVRVVLFFGELRSGVRSLTSSLETFAGTLEKFTEEVRADLRDLDGRLRVVEDRSEVPR